MTRIHPLVITSNKSCNPLSLSTFSNPPHFTSSASPHPLPSPSPGAFGVSLRRHPLSVEHHQTKVGIGIGIGNDIDIAPFITPTSQKPHPPLTVVLTFSYHHQTKVSIDIALTFP